MKGSQRLPGDQLAPGQVTPASAENDRGQDSKSDLAGFGQGFRDTNVWLAYLTGGGLPTWFYIGDALGSFNSRVSREEV